MDSLFLASNTDSASSSTSGLHVLTTDLEVPVVSKTSVKSDLLHSFNIFTEVLVNLIGNKLSELSVLVVLLSVEEPVGDLELAWVGDNCKDSLLLVLSQLTSSVFFKKGKRERERTERINSCHLISSSIER